MPSLTDVIASLIGRARDGTLLDTFSLRDWVIAHEALPVMTDMGGAYALSSRGDVVSFMWGRENDVHVETNPRMRRVAMFRASLQYPELQPFVAARPAHAVDCSHCAGTGTTKSLPEELAKTLICFCGGCGWILPGEA